MLDKLQSFALDKFNNGFNLFITGKAGCGKSFLVKKMMELDNKKIIAVTSTTGISSLNINGRTFHSWCGITPETDLEDIDKFVEEISSNHKKWNKWIFTDILIIDEISMLDGKLIDFVNKVAKIVRGNNNKFGGIQLILTGDFYQLPPVNKSKSIFCFESECWNTIIDEVIILEQSYRQDEKDLIKFLGFVREGRINEFVTDQLKFYSENPNYNLNQYTHLFPHRKDVNRHNIKKLLELSGEVYKNKASVISLLNKKEVDYFPKDTTITQHLQLKKGALVIINKNIDQDIGLVNGRQCIIEDIKGNSQSISSLIISLSNGSRHTINKCSWTFNDYEIEQFPITLAWALTIHKAQGMGIEKLSVDIGLNIFNKGQVYVALSRCINSKYLHIMNYNISAIKSHQNVKQFYNRVRKTFWYKFTNDKEKIFYQNRDTDETAWKLPKYGEIVEEPSSEGEESILELNPSNSVDSTLCKSTLCKICVKNTYYMKYWTDYRETVCLQCISKNKNEYFKQFNKTEIKNEYNINDKKLDSILPNCKFSYERSAFGYRSTKIYLLGHIKKCLFEQKDLLDYFQGSLNKSLVDKSSDKGSSDKRSSDKNKSLDKRSSDKSLVKKSLCKKSSKKPSHEITMELFSEGQTIEEICKDRDLKMGSIIAHLIKNMPHPLIKWDKFMTKSEYDEIVKCIDVMGNDTAFNIIKRNVSSRISYEKIRLVRAFNSL